jgi:hypothetical protein
MYTQVHLYTQMGTPHTQMGTPLYPNGYPYTQMGTHLIPKWVHQTINLK